MVPSGQLLECVVMRHNGDKKEQKEHKQGHTYIINLLSFCGPNCDKKVIITMYSVEQQLVAPKGKLSDVRFGTPPWS